MPRKGPAPKRPLVVDPVYGSPLVTQLVNKILMDGKKSIAETIVYGALEGTRAKTGTDPVVTLKRALDNIKPALEVKSRPCWWRHLPGADRGQGWSTDHAGSSVDGGLLPSASREDHDRASDERDSRCEQRPGCCCETSRRHAQDGRVEQGLRALPLVIPTLLRVGSPTRNRCTMRT